MGHNPEDNSKIFWVSFFSLRNLLWPVPKIVLKEKENPKHSQFVTGSQQLKMAALWGTEQKGAGAVSHVTVIVVCSVLLGKILSGKVCVDLRSHKNQACSVIM